MTLIDRIVGASEDLRHVDRERMAATLLWLDAVCAPASRPSAAAAAASTS